MEVQTMPNLTLTCPACKAVVSLDVPAGRTWFLCPRCSSGVPFRQEEPVLDQLEEVEEEQEEVVEGRLEEVMPEGAARRRRERPRRGRRRRRSRGVGKARRKFLAYLIGPVACLAGVALTGLALYLFLRHGKPAPPDAQNPVPVYWVVVVAYPLLLGGALIASGIRGIAEEEIILIFRSIRSLSLVQYTGNDAAVYGFMYCFFGILVAGWGLFVLMSVYRVL
jgi:hypothetical protein